MADVRPPREISRSVSITAGILLSMVFGIVTAATGGGDTGPAGAVRAAGPIDAALVPSYGAMWGAWVAPVGGQSSAQAVAGFESTEQRRLDIVHQYHAFNETWPTSTEYSWAAGGRIIFANISARQTSGSVLTWSAIAGGSQDSVIDATAARVRAFGRLLFVSFDEEPEDRYHSNPSTYTLASFVAAYRHIHDRFAADGASNVVWVWNVSGYSGDESIYPALYPGDSYVGWIAWDPYNWNTCIHPYGWQTFDQIVAPFYNWVAGGYLSGGSAAKPYMLAEYGSVENSGSPTKGQWFLGEASTISSRPRIKAVVYFNENKDCNWPMTTSSGSVAGFTSAGLSCWFNRAAPSAPTSVSASPGNGSAAVRWAASASVCPITLYTVLASGGKAITVSGSTLSATFGGLSNGGVYAFQVQATSVNGNSAWSASTAPITPTGVAQASPAATPGARPSATPTGRATATPTGKATADPPGGGVEKTSALTRNADGLTAWLEAHAYAIPIALLVLLGFGLGTQFLSSRRHRGS